jgi:hypothetical protein
MAISLPHSLVFQDRKNEEDFLEEANSPLNRELLGLLEIIRDGNIYTETLPVMNEAWYIAKWVFMQKEPKVLHFERRLKQYINDGNDFEYCYIMEHGVILAYYILKRQKELPAKISEFLPEMEKICLLIIDKGKSIDTFSQQRHDNFYIMLDCYRAKIYTTNLYLEVEDSIPTADIEKATANFSEIEIKNLLPYYGNIQQQLAFINIAEKAFIARASVPTTADLSMLDYINTAPKPDFKKLKEEIKAGKYLPEQNTALPQLPENANEEAIRINDQYKKRIEQLTLHVQALEKQIERMDVQKKLDIQWLAEIEAQKKELEKTEELIASNECYIDLLNAQLDNKDKAIEALKEELESAQIFAAEKAKGQAKQLAKEIETLKLQLEESRNTNQVKWDILFETAIEKCNINDIAKISMYLSQVIIKADPLPDLYKQLSTRVNNLSNEVEENKMQEFSANVYNINNVNQLNPTAENVENNYERQLYNSEEWNEPHIRIIRK